MSDRISVAQGQWRLAYIWLAGAAISLVLLLTQTMGQKFGDQYDKAWSWFLTTVVPILTLMIGALVYQARSGDDATVDRRMFLLSAALSSFYLVLVFGVLISTAFTSAPLERMTQAQLWLSPTHALTSSALGAFFVSKKDS